MGIAFNFVSLQTKKTTPMKKRVLFITNPISGGTSKAGIPHLIDKYLDKDRFDYEIKFTEYAGHGAEMASEAAREGVDVIAAVGGDGTVNEVARAITHTSSALAILPCGSGNGLARHLMIPMNMRKSIEVINLYAVRDLDYGVINGHPFFCTCGMGFDADISQKFAEAGKRGPITYVQKVLEEALKYKPQTYQIEIDGDKAAHKAFLISCANASQYGNNAYIAPQASMSDGYMDVVIMEPFDLLEAPQIAIDMFNKTLDKSSRIKSFRAKQLVIHREKPGVIHFDGDPVMAEADVEVKLHPQGFKALINPKADNRILKPNAVQSAAADLFNEINIVRDDLTKQGRHVLALSKVLQRKLNL